jgi:predicted nucleic acid-binding protein
VEEKISVFLDSNVIFSMAYSGKNKSRSYLLIDMEQDGILSLYTSELALNEARINLAEKNPDALNEFEKISLIRI